MSVFEDMLDEFRALGGTAGNIRLGQGAFGRGLFPADPSRPVAIRVPENLLIDAKDATFEGGRFRVASRAQAGARERAFLEAYQDRFSWGAEGRAEIERLFEQAAALPPELRHALKTRHGCGGWFDDASDELVRQKFLQSRSITYRGRTVMMPVVELVNHGMESDFDVSDGVGVRGSFAGEILTRYSDTDSFGVFLNWGFAAPQPIAMSTWLAGIVGPTRLKIDRDFDRFKVAERTKIPVITPGGDAPKLSFLMIGCRPFPGFCRGIFHKVLRDAGLGGHEESFDTILHANRMHFLDLLTAIEEADGPLMHTLRRMALYQLREMSFCFGVRSLL